MAKAKFSEIYRTAATLLASDQWHSDGNNVYSCPAISTAAVVLEGGKFSTIHPARKYYPMQDVPYFSAFDEFPEGIEQQAARFLWLNMLAELAESEGN